MYFRLNIAIYFTEKIKIRRIAYMWEDFPNFNHNHRFYFHQIEDIVKGDMI